MLLQVLSLTPDQINALAPNEREAINALVRLISLPLYQNSHYFVAQPISGHGWQHRRTASGCIDNRQSIYVDTVSFSVIEVVPCNGQNFH